MNLILQAIKSMFRGLTKKVDRNTEQITEHTASINGLQNGMKTARATAETAQKTANSAQTTAKNAQNTANTVQTEIKGCLRYYSTVFTATPIKTSQLEVGELSRLLELPTNVENFRKTCKAGDVLKISFLYYNEAGTAYSKDVELKHDGYNFAGGRWVVVDGVAQYYEVALGEGAFNSKIIRYV